MKIRNDFIKIKTKNKNITIQNTILDNYLDELAKGNLGTGSKRIKTCHIKLDTPIKFETSSLIPKTAFDFYFYAPSFYETPSKNSNTIQYDFFTQYAATTVNGEYINVDVSYYKDRKIASIGFGVGDNDNIVAIVDISNYDLRINSFLSISRKDIISTDLEFKSDIFEYPLHLLFEEYLMTYKDNNTVRAKLKEIGLSNTKDKIKERISITNTSVKNGTLTIKDLKNINSYARTYLPNFTPFYSTRSNYKYIFYIYEVTYYTYNPTIQHVWGEYYQIDNLDLTGEIEANIKYERSTL